MGHTENLSHQELAERLDEDDFECRHEGCSKQYSYAVDHRFWDSYVRAKWRKPFL